jgi:photosystem II stability/assembly factor-like uncharacterized protein
MNFRHLQFVVGMCGCALAVGVIAAQFAPSSSSTNAHIDLRGARAGIGGVPLSAPLSSEPFVPAVGGGAWSRLGPPGGDVADVAVSPTNPNIVLAGVAPGGGWGGTLYRSIDAGANWAPVSIFAGTSVRHIEFTASGKVYAATQDSVWSSTDDGHSWVHLNLGIDPINDEAFTVAIDPSNASTIWAGISDAAGFQSVNLMRSLDGGATWHDRTPPHAGPMTGASIAIDPAHPATVIAGFHGDFGGGEVWVTTDGGDTWHDRSNGLPGNPINAVSYTGTRLFAAGGQNFGSQDVGIYSSDDLGVSWKPMNDATWPLLIATSIAVDPNDAQTILVATDGTGINRSHDGGTTWELGVGNTGAFATQSVRFAPGSSQQVFIGANSLGVFKSTDGGNGFAGSSNGISELNLRSIAANPANPQQLAAAFQGNNSGGVFSSSDGGATWTVEAVPPTRYSKVGFSPSGVLYAISSGPSSIAPEGLYRREGNGQWTSLGPDQGNLYESDLAALRFSAHNPDLILLGGADFGVAGNESTVWRSTDAGQTWVKQYEGDGGAFVSDIQIAADGTDQTMVASYTGYNTPDQGGVLRSVDGGATWTPVYAQATYGQRPKLCTPVGHAQTFFLGAANGWATADVLRSNDGGVTWTPTGWTGATIADIACDAVDPDVLYVAQSSGTPVMRSTDQGASFAAFADGLGAVGAPSELAIARAGNDMRLLMATGKGSYVTPLEVGDAIFANGFD